MSDYSNEISKIFNFISKDLWKMDLDGNGEIIEAECKYYLKESLKNNEIPDLKLENVSEQEDLVFQFWRSINTDRSVKSIASLDSKEIAAMQKRICMESVLLKYTNNLKAPNYAGINDSEWKRYVSEALQKAIDNHGGMESFKSEDELEEFIQLNLKNAEYEATVYSVTDTEANSFIDKFKEYINELPADLQEEIKDFVEDALKNRVDLENDELASYIGTEVNSIIKIYTNRTDATDLNVAKRRIELFDSLKKEALNDTEIKEKIAKIGENGQKALENALNVFLSEDYVRANFEKLKTLSTGDLLAEFKGSDAFKNIENLFNQANAKDEVTALLTAEEMQSVTVFDFVEQRFAHHINIGRKGIDYTDAHRASNERFVKEILKDIVKEYNESDIDKYIEEAKTTGLDFKNIPDSKEIAKYVLKKLGYDESSVFKEEPKDSELLQALVNNGISKEVAMKILNLSEAEINSEQYSDYNAELQKIIKECADGTITDKTKLIDRLASGIKALVETGVFKEWQEQAESTTFDNSKKSEVLSDDNVIDVKATGGELTFKLAENGKIEFISSNGSAVETNLNKVRSKLEEAYSKQLAQYLPDKQQRENLWNMALFLTLSNPSVVNSLHKNFEQLGQIVDKIVDTYADLLQNAAQDDAALDYVTKYHSRSIVSGMTINDLSSFYTSGSTNNSPDAKTLKEGDDKVNKDSKLTTEQIYEYNGKTAQILAYDTGHENDDYWVNESLRKLLTEFIKTYRKRDDNPYGLEETVIMSLFKQAEQIAFTNVNNNVLESYGYAASGLNEDAVLQGKCITVQAVLMETIYQTEKLLDAKIMHQDDIIQTDNTYEPASDEKKTSALTTNQNNTLSVDVVFGGNRKNKNSWSSWF